MQGDFITNMKLMYNQFSKTEKKVADYVLNNPKAVPYIDQSFKTAVTLIGGILLAVLGIIFQFRHTKKEKKR